MLTFVPSRRWGSENLVYNGYRFRCNKSTHKVIYYQCCERNCSSKLTTDVSKTKIVRPPTAHNHPPMESAIKEDEIRNQMLREIQNEPSMTALQVYEKVVDERKICDESFPKFSKLRSAIYRSRGKPMDLTLPKQKRSKLRCCDTEINACSFGMAPHFTTTAIDNYNLTGSSTVKVVRANECVTFHAAPPQHLQIQSQTAPQNSNVHNGGPIVIPTVVDSTLKFSSHCDLTRNAPDFLKVDAVNSFAERMEIPRVTNPAPVTLTNQVLDFRLKAPPQTAQISNTFNFAVTNKFIVPKVCDSKSSSSQGATETSSVTQGSEELELVLSEWEKQIQSCQGPADIFETILVR